MPTIRDAVIQFLQQIRSPGETAPHARGSEGAMPRLALSPGAEVLATVMGKLDNGMSLVRVSSQLFAMELPSRFQTGDSLRMTFLSQDGRPTFALASQTLSGTPLTMSSAGRLLRRLMGEPLADEISSRSPLPKMERLVEGPPNDTARLAGRLRQALGESGLFYESHLKEWAKGERPLAAILREPQAALSRPEARIRAAEASGAERVSSESAVKEPGRAAGDGEKRGGVTTGLREEGGRPAGEAVSERRGTAGNAADDLRHNSASERSAVSSHVREQVSSLRESPGKVPGTAGIPCAGGGERIPTGTGSAEKTPGAAEQRARLLRETYSQLNHPLVQRDVRKPPDETARAEVERSAGPSRTDSAVIRTEVNQQPPPSSAAGTAGVPADGEGKEGGISSPAASLQGEIADARALPLVRQQLNLLTSGLFLWQGEAWQGQPMEWEVMEREAHPEQGEGSAWQTTLRLDLPNLGRVSAVISLEGHELLLSLEAGASESASLLGGRTGELRERLSAAGIEVKGVAVRHEELEGA